MINNFKFAFFGTPDVASKTLDILFNEDYIPSIIITSPDAPSGRGMRIKESPVSIWAKEHNIKCLKPEKIDPIFINQFKELGIDLSMVVAYGKILKEELIQSPKFGTINIHYSLLPKYRGASPLESSLLNGDEKTGVSIQQMVFKLDSGPIMEKEETIIDINETKEDLKNRLIKIGANLVCKIIPKIINNDIKRIDQDESIATNCSKIDKKDGELDLNNNPIENWNKYRAFYGWPGTYFFKEKNKNKIRIKITSAKYENNSFIIERVIPEGKKEISYKDFLNQN